MKKREKKPDWVKHAALVASAAGATNEELMVTFGITRSQVESWERRNKAGFSRERAQQVVAKLVETLRVSI